MKKRAKWLSIMMGLCLIGSLAAGCTSSGASNSEMENVNSAENEKDSAPEEHNQTEDVPEIEKPTASDTAVETAQSAKEPVSAQTESYTSLRDNVLLVTELMEQSPTAWAEYFSDDAIYRYSAGGQPEPREDEINRAYQISVAEWLEQLPEDITYFNPYQASYIFARVNTEGLTAYEENTGHYAYDQGKFFDYQVGYEDTVFADTVIAKRLATWTEDGQAYSEYRFVEFNFDAEGKIILLREIEDSVQETNWLAEYDAGTYASCVAGQVFTGKDIDTYNSIYPSQEALLASNLSTIGRWWDSVGYYRCWLRFPLVTEDATMGTNYLMYSNELFNNPYQLEALYYNQTYSRDTLGGNRVVECWKQGWLDLPDANSTWGWTSDNRVYVCADDPNLIISDSINTFGGHMYLSFTMRDGLVRDFRETRLWFEAMVDNTFEQVSAGNNDPNAHG